MGNPPRTLTQEARWIYRMLGGLRRTLERVYGFL